MKNNRKNKGSFVSFLIKYYIGFTLAIAILILTAFYSYLMIEEGLLRIPKVDRLIRQIDLLKKEDYEAINAPKLLGKKGYFEVLNDRNEVVYSSSGHYGNSYTLGELSYIQDYYSPGYYYSQKGTTSSGEQRYFITELNYSEKENIYKETSFALLNENFEVIECTGMWPYHTMTKREYEYLTKSGPENYDVQKHIYTNNQNRQNTLIIHTEKLNDTAYAKLSQISRFLIPIFTVLYVILIAAFIFRLNKQVKKPLAILNHAMLDFADGIRNMPVEYNGPSEFVRICDSFNKMSSRLKESESAKQKLDQDRQKMLADISHDLKTPITVIQGYSKALTEGLIPEEKKDKYLNTIYHKANGLTELINTFYEYSKLEHPDFSLEKEETDICEFCREYIASKYEEIEIAGFITEISIPEQRIICFLDRMQFKRVLENILVNALKHNPSGTTLFFIIEDTPNQAVLLLGDNGVGIPEEIAGTIFNPFTVGDESRNNKQGSGLGLAIAQKIVAAHEGAISLVLPPGDGMATEFRIALPRKL